MFSSFNMELHENLVLSHVRKSFHSALKLTHQAEQLRILNFVYPKPLVMQYVQALARLGVYEIYILRCWPLLLADAISAET